MQKKPMTFPPPNKNTPPDPPPLEKTTPMMEQYYSIKKKHSDKFVFFRLGDFYELFLEDAIEASKLLSLTLTQRAGKPMCGIPHHQLHAYTARLIAKGKKIVIVDQTGELPDPKATSKLVKREVTEILTPGTTNEWHTLAAKENNFLLSLSAETHDIFSLPIWTACVVDVSTGEVELYDWGQGSEFFIAEKVIAMGIREVLLAKNSHTASLSTQLKEKSEPIVINIYPESEQGSHEQESLEKTLQKFYPHKSADLLAFTLKQTWGMLEPESETKPSTSPPKNTRKANPILGQTPTTHYGRYLRNLVPLLRYIGEEQLRTLDHLKLPTLAKENYHLILDAAAIKNLELFRNNYDNSQAHTLVQSLDETQTAMGGRLLRRVILRPLAQKSALDERLQRVTWFVNHPHFLDSLRKTLHSIQDIERLMGRLGMGKMTPKELRAFSKSLATTSEVFKSFLTEELVHRKETAETMETELPKLKDLKTTSDFFWEGEGFYTLKQALVEGSLPINHLISEAPIETVEIANLGTVPSLFYRAVLFFNRASTMIDETLLDEPQNDFVEGGVIRETDNKALHHLHHKRRNLLQELTKLWTSEKQKTGITSLKLKYTDNIGYFFEVTKSNVAAVPDYFQKKQTLVGGERFITSELLDLEKSVRENLAKITETEKTIYQTLLEQVRIHIPIFQQVGRTIGFIDLWSTFAFLALRRNYVCPQFVDNATFIYEAGRHPVIEQTESEPFVANSLNMNKQTSVLHIITGPNMAGKSTFLRQTVIIALMAHMGSFVPAQKAQLPVLDRIFTRIGAADRLSKGESTFLVEMNETADILHNATHKSLVIMDEIGRGTSTYDGLAIAWSVLEYLTENSKRRPYTLFATHYHELTQLSHISCVENYHLKIKEEGSRLLFLKRVITGNAGKSYGVHVARLAGIPQSVIVKAQERLRYFEKTASAKTTPTEPNSLITAEEIKAIETALETERNFHSKVKSFFETLDINNLTPIQALHKLEEFSKKFKA